MYIVFIVLIFIVSLLIILAVLAQNPKGGMAANFGVSNQVMGVRQTTSFLERFTWGLALVLLVLSVGATMTLPKDKIQASRSAMDKGIEQSAPANTFGPMQQPGDDAIEEMEFDLDAVVPTTEEAEAPVQTEEE